MSILNGKGEISNRAVGFSILGVLCAAVFFAGVKYGRELPAPAKQAAPIDRAAVMRNLKFLYEQPFYERIFKEAGCVHLNTHVVYDGDGGQTYLDCRAAYSDNSVGEFIVAADCTADRLAALVARNRPAMTPEIDPGFIMPQKKAI